MTPGLNVYTLVFPFCQPNRRDKLVRILRVLSALVSTSGSWNDGISSDSLHAKAFPTEDYILAHSGRVGSSNFNLREICDEVI